jgi:acetoin utilization protein AcuB
MLVRDVMQRAVVTVAPDTPLDEVVARARSRGIRHLPVLAGEALVGIVSDRDLKRAAVPGAGAPAARTAQDVMSRAVITIGPMFAVEDAARTMVEERISALPVTEDGRLVGIVTETDVLHLFVRSMGVTEPSTRLELDLDGAAAGLGAAAGAVERAGTRIASILTLAGPAGAREVVMRIATIDPLRAVAALRAAGYAVREPVRGAS